MQLDAACSTMYGRIISCVTWSCKKIQTLFIFSAICDNTAHVQWIRCSPKGSHLIHWTSAVFSHMALKWTPFAYHHQGMFCFSMQMLRMHMVSPYNARLCVFKPWRRKLFFQFEISINDLVSSFRSIWIPMLWICGHYKYLNSFDAGIFFIHQNMTFADVRVWRI